jgi:Ca2+/H+ antiporter
MENITPVRILGLVVVAFCGNVAPLWAADAARQDNSDLFVWIFLGFCALIVVAQLIPAVMMLLGFAKGVKKSQAPPAHDPVNHLTSSDA